MFFYSMQMYRLTFQFTENESTPIITIISFSNHLLYVKKSVVSSISLKVYRVRDCEFIDRELDVIF